jgi:uncharacterized protein
MQSNVRKESFLNLNGKSLAYYLQIPEGEDGPFPLVIASHGFGGTKEGSNDFSLKLAEKLTGNKIALLSYDFRGCGKSSHKMNELDLHDFIEDLNDIFNFASTHSLIDEESIALQGTSFGGLVTSLASSEFHKLIQGLALIVPAAYGKTWQSIYDESLEELKDHDLLPFYDHMLKRSFVVNFLKARADLSFEKYCKHLPSLLIAAEKDEVIPFDHALAYKEASSNMSFEKIEGADHSFLNIEAQEAMILSLSEFYFTLFKT